MREIKSSHDLEKTLGRNKYTVVDFTAKWCNPCQGVKKYLKGLSEDYTEIEFVYVDIDVVDDLAEEYNVKSIPLVLFFQGEDLRKDLTVTGNHQSKLLSGVEMLLSGKSRKTSVEPVTTSSPKKHSKN